jgi:hypothetical protein
MLDYTQIKAHKIPLHEKPIPHVKWDDIRKALGDQYGRFQDLFGIQTCLAEGPYASDVEAVLERMVSGKLIGTQLFMD